MKLDKHSKRNYSVDAMPIMDLLEKYNAPKDIDFMNLDIEGSEGEVLDHLDFDVYNVKLICIEGGDQYGEFMKSKGYQLCDNSGYDLSNDNLFFEKV